MQLVLQAQDVTSTPFLTERQGSQETKANYLPESIYSNLLYLSEFTGTTRTTFS